MRINHNISALFANNQLNKTNNALTKSLEKLSSGYKINRASDDAAGMAISEKMRTQIAALDQASQNAADGISVIQTAEGALSEVESILQRMRELSVQAANDTNTSADRSSIQAEIDQMNQEIQRISTTTEFNTKKLLDGSIERRTYTNGTVSVLYASDAVDSKNYSMTVTQDARQAVITGSTVTMTSTDTISASEAGTVTINGTAVSVEEGDTLSDIYEKLRDAGENLGINVFGTTEAKLATSNLNYSSENAGYVETAVSSLTGNSLAFVSDAYGSGQKIELTCSNSALASKLGLTTTTTTAKGVDAKVSLGSGFSSTATVSVEGNRATVTDSSGFEMTYKIEDGTAGTTFSDTDITSTSTSTTAAMTAHSSGTITTTVLEAGPMDLQIGANEGQTMTVSIPKVNPETLGIADINVKTDDGAQNAISDLDNAIAQVSSIRSKLGAYENRLEHSIDNLDTTSENMSEAISRIQDTDMASEMATYTQLQVLVQAGTSMLAQANERPQTVLTLLQG